MASNSNVSDVSKKEFNDFSKKGYVLIDFFADWCMPCQVMAPIMDELSKKFKGKVKFGKINIDDNQELAQKFEVFSIPNFVLFKDGKVIEQFVGSMSAEAFEERLNKFI